MTSTVQQKKSDPFVDKYGRSVFRYRPPPDEDDQEYCALRDIARQAVRRNDERTLGLLRERGREFFRRHPHYIGTCFTAEFFSLVGGGM